jgi:hypothetical protein
MEAVVHAQWTDHALRLWAERVSDNAHAAQAEVHPGAVPPDTLAALLSLAHARADQCRLLLPTRAPAEPVPSDLAARLGHRLAPVPDELRPWNVPCLTVPSPDAPAVIDALVVAAAGDSVPFALGPGLEYAAAVLALARHLIAQQRVVPMLAQEGSGELKASWRPWLSDEATSARVEKLAAAMPAVFRAGVDACKHQPWAILDDMLWRLCDALCRIAFRADDLDDTVRGRDAADPHVAWMQALLNGHESVPASPASRQEMIRRVRRWIGGLEDRGASSQWRLALKLVEPLVDTADEKFDPRAGTPWTLDVALQAHDDPGVLIDASDIWLLSGDAAVVEGRRLERAQELLLAELARAARIYPRLDELLRTSEPSRLACSTKHAYEFLRDVRPVLMEQGFGVIAPLWWDAPTSRLGARLRLDSAPLSDLTDGAASSVAGASPQLGLATLVDYRWEIAVGDAALSLHEFEQLAAKRSPLVRINGRWVEIRPEDVQAAVKFIRENPGGEMKVGDASALRSRPMHAKRAFLSVGIEASGWLNGLPRLDQAANRLPDRRTPGRLPWARSAPIRSAASRGCAFLEKLRVRRLPRRRHGPGQDHPAPRAACSHERSSRDRSRGRMPPASGRRSCSCPCRSSATGSRETGRFCPEPPRPSITASTRAFGDEARRPRRSRCDLVVTTYALANRDREHLERIHWRRIVLDEAQYIKNPQAKQSQAVRSFAARRVALTGTPVENRLTELWSIMDFLNPGYLGAPRLPTRFAVAHRAVPRRGSSSEQLRALVRPFVLRRSRPTPPSWSDLPEKLETREFCHLTSEQASLYESCVSRMLATVDAAEGIQRRGLVLSRPDQAQADLQPPVAVAQRPRHPEGGQDPRPLRSGKCIRLLEMLDEIVAEGDKALIFTQFRQMGAPAPTSCSATTFDGQSSSSTAARTQQAQREDHRDLPEGRVHPGPHPVASRPAASVSTSPPPRTSSTSTAGGTPPSRTRPRTAPTASARQTVQVHKFVIRGHARGTHRPDDRKQDPALAENIIGFGRASGSPN